QLLQQGHRRVRLPARGKDQREVVGRFPIVAAAGERITETPFRLGEIAGASGEQAKIVERFRKIGLQRQRLFVQRARLLIAPCEQQRAAESGQGVRVIGVRGQRGPESADRRVEISTLREQRSEVVVSLGEI